MLAKLLSGLLFLLGTAHAAEFNNLLPERSRIQFVSKQMGVPVEGGFNRFEAKIRFDPVKPEAGSVELSIDLASVDAGSAEANDEVVGKNWFNVKSFPQARFVSSSVRSLGNNRYEARGRMSIKGRTRDVSAPFIVKSSGNQGLFEGSFVLKRLDYGIGEGTWGDPSVVADEIQVRFSIVVATSALPKTKK